MKNVKTAFKSAINKIAKCGVNIMNKLKGNSNRRKLILGGSGVVIILMIIGLTICLVNINIGKNDLTLTSSGEDKTNLAKTALTTKAEVQKDPVASITATNTVASATIPDGNGGAVANPDITNNQPKPVPEGSPESVNPPAPEQPSKPAEKPSQPTEQPSTPDRESAVAITNYLKSTFTNQGTNNSNIHDSSCICTPGFLANAMPIIDNFIAGGISEGTARSKIAALDVSGDADFGDGRILITETGGANVVDVTVPGSGGRHACLDASISLNGGGVMDVGVTYDASSDTYHVKGIMILCDTQFKDKV